MLSSVLIPLVLLFAGAATLIEAYVITRRQQLATEQRVDLVSNVAPAMTAGDWLVTQSGKFDRIARTIFAVGAARFWGMKSGAVKLIAGAAVAAGAAWLLVQTLMGLTFWLAVPLAALSGFVLPRQILLREQKHTEHEFLEYFPDAVEACARMLRAGIPISAAIHSIGAEAAPPISTVFSQIADQVGIGTRIEEALDTTSRQVGLADFRFFAVAIILQHATGGNLVATLEILSSIIRRRRAVRLKAGAATAEIRISAYVVGSLPLLIIGALLLLQPGYLSPLFSDPRGHAILAMAAGGLVLAAVTMRQLMRTVTEIV